MKKLGRLGLRHFRPRRNEAAEPGLIIDLDKAAQLRLPRPQQDHQRALPQQNIDDLDPGESSPLPMQPLQDLGLAAGEALRIHKLGERRGEDHILGERARKPRHIGGAPGLQQGAEPQLYLRFGFVQHRETLPGRRHGPTSQPTLSDAGKAQGNRSREENAPHAKVGARIACQLQKQERLPMRGDGAG